MWILAAATVWCFWTKSRDYDLEFEQEANRHRERMEDIRLKFTQESNRHSEEMTKMQNAHEEEMKKIDVALVKEYKEFLVAVLPLVQQSNSKLNQEAKDFTEMILKHDVEIVNKVLDMINQSVQARQTNLFNFMNNVAGAALQIVNMKQEARNWYTDYVFRMIKLYLSDLDQNYGVLLDLINKLLTSDDALKERITAQLQSTRNAMNAISERVAGIAANFPGGKPTPASIALLSVAPPLYIPVSSAMPVARHATLDVRSPPVDAGSSVAEVVSLLQQQIVTAWQPYKVKALRQFLHAD